MRADFTAHMARGRQPTGVTRSGPHVGMHRFGFTSVAINSNAVILIK